MSDRIKKSWQVLRSIEMSSGDYCVDFFVREDNTFGFEAFRRDSEDMGRWSGINYFSIMSFRSMDDALAEAKHRITWLQDEMYE